MGVNDVFNTMLGVMPCTHGMLVEEVLSYVGAREAGRC